MVFVSVVQQVERYLDLGHELERASAFASILVCVEFAGGLNAKTLDWIRCALRIFFARESSAHYVSAGFAWLVRV